MAEPDDVDYKSGQSERMSKVRKLVTVEPILFFFMFGSSLLFPTVSALVYRKVCISQYDTEICDNLKNETNRDREDKVQSETAYWFLLEHLSFEIPSILLSFFYGSLSDNVSRKLTLILPAIGQLLSSANYIFQSIYIELPVGYILIGTFLSGTFGGWVTCNMAAFSYLSDVTNDKSRTFRIAVAEATISISIGISFFISGVTLDHTSFQFVTTLALAMYVVVLVYIFAWIREPPSSRRSGNKSCSAICGIVCSPRNVKEAIGCIFKKRERNGRGHILLSFAILITGIVGTIAGFTLGYLYVRKQPLSWTQTMYGVFAGYSLAVGAVGQLVVVPLFRDRLGMRETSILICALISNAIGLVVFGCSVYTWMVFLVPVVGIIGDSQSVILRSVLSKMVEKNELGRMFATFGALQSLSGLIGTLLYNNVYPKTLSFWPGFSFVLGAVILTIPVILTVLLRKDLKKQGWEAYMAIQQEILGDSEEEGLIDLGTPESEEIRDVTLDVSPIET